jgi:hypothetical protein
MLRRHPEERALARVSKDGLRESWPSFEARKSARLRTTTALFIPDLLG